LDLNRLGALVTNTLSLEPRSPANPPRVLAFPGGFLIHSGHPNPGLSRAIGKYHRAWADLPVPVVANLLALSPDEAAEMVQMLEGLENVMAVELLVQAEPMEGQSDLIEAVCSGELPVIARLPMTASTALVKTAEEAGVQAVSLGPPRGRLKAPSGELVSGRLFGATTLALGLEALQRWRSAVNLPLIGGSGLHTIEDIGISIIAGAAGVQLGLPLWRQIHQDAAWMDEFVQTL
jgi:dihydroorotate dehydrogenase (NAD+) catalytic subunit